MLTPLGVKRENPQCQTAKRRKNPARPRSRRASKLPASVPLLKRPNAVPRRCQRNCRRNWAARKVPNPPAMATGKKRESSRISRVIAACLDRGSAKVHLGTKRRRHLMFIQTESTPNPATLKFLPGCPVMGEAEVAAFPRREAAGRSPLARALFAVPDVSRVFFGSDFISVTKGDGDWKHLKVPVLAAIMDHFTRG